MTEQVITEEQLRDILLEKMRKNIFKLPSKDIKKSRGKSRDRTKCRWG